MLSALVLFWWTRLTCDNSPRLSWMAVVGLSVIARTNVEIYKCTNCVFFSCQCSFVLYSSLLKKKRNEMKQTNLLSSSAMRLYPLTPCLSPSPVVYATDGGRSFCRKKKNASVRCLHNKWSADHTWNQESIVFDRYFKSLVPLSPHTGPAQLIPQSLQFAHLFFWIFLPAHFCLNVIFSPPDLSPHLPHDLSLSLALSPKAWHQGQVNFCSSGWIQLG